MAGIRVLIVDDDPDLRELLSASLREAGYHPLTAATAREALEVISGSNGGLGAVVADLKMPGEDGLWLLERVKERWPRTADSTEP